MEKYLQLITSNTYMAYTYIVILSIVSYVISRFLIVNLLTYLFKNSSNKVDDILINKGILNRLSYLVPLIIFYNLYQSYFGKSIIVNRCIKSLFVLLFIFIINSLINAIKEIYNKSSYSTSVSITSYIQIIKLITNLFLSIVLIAVILGKPLYFLLSGIGALAAVLMLVFKDTILSFVATIQISSNDLFKIGDWVEASQFGADGDVVDIGLHSIKIQNWDKTISVIPTYKLTDSSFKNWRAMSESGGRRIKRAINIDMNSIKFCNDDMINKYKTMTLIKDYINNKISEINDYNNQQINIDKSSINGRCLTNIGTYREYIKSYLKNNKNIHSDMTFLVRQLSPTERGLPIEIYVFSNNTNWIEYEAIQSDIFDHLIAALGYFNLRIYQYPSGHDISK